MVDKMSLVGYIFGCFLLWILTASIGNATRKTDTTTNELKAFCQNEEFTAECEPEHVVVIGSARYGRMRLNRCVRRDYGFISCGRDVLAIADAQCSGRRSCSIRVPNELLDATRPCPEDFKTYLEISYECVKVTLPTKKLCMDTSSTTLTVPSATIASIVTRESVCGTVKSPWLVKVDPGRRINITLMDFSYGAIGKSRSSASCLAYAIVKEEAVVKSTTICGGIQRVVQAYYSITNQLQIVILGGHEYSAARHFLLKYEATGCPSPPKPLNGWARREDQQATLGCDHTSDRWQLICKGSKWSGNYRNCTALAAERQQAPPTKYILSLDMAILLIICLALLIAACVLGAGIAFLKYSYKKTMQKEMATYAAGPNVDECVATERVESDGQHRATSAKDRANDQSRVAENQYAYIADSSSGSVKYDRPIYEEGTLGLWTLYRCSVPTTSPYSSLDQTQMERAAESSNQQNSSRNYPASESSTSHQYFVFDPNHDNHESL